MVSCTTALITHSSAKVRVPRGHALTLGRSLALAQCHRSRSERDGCHGDLVDQELSGGFRLGRLGGLALGSFGELAVDEGRPGADERDQVGCVIMRQRRWADSISLKAIARAAALDPRPLVTLVRSLTVANVDSIGLVVRRCTQCLAG